MSWLGGPTNPLFGLDNLPYGVARRHDGDSPRVVVRIHEQVLDVGGAADATGATDLAAIMAGGNLDAHLAQGPAAWAETRDRIQTWLDDPRYANQVGPHLHPLDGAELLLPWTVADYVDFYSSEHHAANVGRLFRPGTPPLLPNWKHLPVGYHGRAGTVVASGTPVVRPNGQRRSAEDEAPVFGPTERLDFEAEVGFVVGAPSTLGRPVPLGEFADHVFGAVLVNDWSARDIQSWEYVPLGPFLAKSFLTSASPWIVPLAALEAARVPAPARDVPLLAYLDDADAPPWGLDLSIHVRVNGGLVSAPPFAGMYWTPAQQLAHLTINGASVRTGDLYASGTVSGPSQGQLGSLLELTANGREPIELPDGTERTFLLDGDHVTLTATAPGTIGRIAFGEVSGQVLPAPPAS